jgi:PAS domain S-box-containing protein
VVLQHLEEAVLVIDENRILRFVNDRARRLLGYDDEQPVGGRCRLTTQGLDCENACPLTFALEGDIERVENFSTVYQTKDGTPVPLRVTVIPLLDDRGGFQGAVEILRASEPDPGFVLAGRGQVSAELQRQVQNAARSGDHLALVGEPPVVADVARAVHRYSGVADSLFHRWSGSWETIQPWPPGTVFAAGSEAVAALGVEPPDDWRVIVGVAEACELAQPTTVSYELIELPQARDLEEDLPLVVAAWVEQLDPTVTIAPAALGRLSRMAREIGFGHLQRVLHAAVAAAEETIEEAHIPTDGYETALLDELLRQPDPLAALEERLLKEVLERSGWRMQEAAERLGISRVTLWRKLKDHGIERPDAADGNQRNG